jgi:hypothetical protein
MADRRKTWLGALAVLAVAQGLFNSFVIYPKWSRDFSVKQQGIAQGLGPDQLLLALAGFREMIAGILWVRADSFFDSGNYDAVLPMIRLVTWLDPNQIDVFATGMWHIAYNFTDEEQRSDRRYIPSALALGKEGAKRNPYTYEMFFETGWLWYHKIDDDYFQAVKWFEKANEYPDMIEMRRNLLSNAYQRNGQINEGLEHYIKLLDDATKEAQAPDASYQSYQRRDTIEANVDTMIVRMTQRGFLAAERNGGKVPDGPYDVNPPFDVGFSARVTVEEYKRLRIEGTWNVLPVGTRIRVVLRDANYPGATYAQMDWDSKEDVALDPPRNWTWMQDQLFVRNRRFNRAIDMSKDPTMYPCKSENYVVEFYYNPRSAPPHIQDKFGWSGEGFTDSNFLRTDVRPNQRVLYTTLELTRDQILRRNEWQDVVPIVQTSNYKAPSRGQLPSDVIRIPTLRSDN